MDKKEILKSIQHIPLFTKLNKEALWKLANLTQLKTFAKGEILMREGETPSGCFIILTGEVEVISKFETANEKIIARLGKNEILGEMAIIDPAPRVATVRAATALECIKIAQWEFLAQLQAYPQIAVELLPVLVKRLRKAEQNFNI